MRPSRRAGGSRSKKQLEDLHARLEGLIGELGSDAATVQKVRAYIVDAKDDTNRLEEIVNAVLLKLDELRNESKKGQSK